MREEKSNPKWKRALRLAFKVYAGLCTILISIWLALCLWGTFTQEPYENEKLWLQQRYHDYSAKESPKKGDYFGSLAQVLGQYASESSNVVPADVFHYLGKPDFNAGTTNNGMLAYFYTPSWTTNRWQVVAILKQGKVYNLFVNDGSLKINTNWPHGEVNSDQGN